MLRWRFVRNRPFPRSFAGTLQTNRRQNKSIPIGKNYETEFAIFIVNVVAGKINEEFRFFRVGVNWHVFLKESLEFVFFKWKQL